MVGSTGADVRFLMGLLIVGVLMDSFQVSLQRLATLDPLPVSRRFLFAAMTLPLIAALVLGFGLGTVARGSFDGTYAIFGLLIVGLWLGLVALSLDPLYAFAGSQTSGWIFFIFVVPAWLSNVLLHLVIERGWIGVNAPVDFAEALGRQLDTVLPGGQDAFFLLCVLLLAGLYALAEAQFRRFEVRGQPENLGGV